PNRTLLSLLPLAMRLAGPREAVWHGIIRRNYGANYFIVGRDHASPGRDSTGRPFYGPFDAQALFARFEAEIGVRMIAFDEVVYLPDEDRYEEARRVPPGRRVWSLSGTRVREDYLAHGQPLPAWFTRPEVSDILARAYPPRHRQGFCVWLTGLPGAGKSTLAEALTAMLLERGRPVTLLDGDEVPTLLSKGLSFSQEDRDVPILRIGFVAAEVVRHGGAVVVAAVSPYAATRDRVRDMVGQDRFILVYVNTPLEVCEQRDAKGLFARARRGEIRGIPGMDAPYEPPRSPDLVADTVRHPSEANARHIVEYLTRRGFLSDEVG
ncbi:MAG: adenylyl-sulfate kinase, partial [Acidobacteria bacterium]|nr:adenylyl-sulfate kinase [Acidobacteriota bacterium]MDW7985568.1 adenylyl-sulfate kinase [Acidobacteriota bacterium]